MTLFSVKDTFLVTGASSGIGRAIALELCAQGARVIANGRDEEKLSGTREAAAFPENIIPAARDLSRDMAGLPNWLLKLAREFGPLRGLALAAGRTHNAPLSYYDMERANQIFDICCHAPLKLAGSFARKQVYAPPASIVFIAAAAALDPNPGQGIYAAAKGGLIAGANCLAKEFAPKKIRVNCISPGLVEGPMLDGTVRLLGRQFLEREEKMYPLGLGRPENVGALAVFLLSEKSAWLTGQNIVQTGGR